MTTTNTEYRTRSIFGYIAYFDRSDRTLPATTVTVRPATYDEALAACNRASGPEEYWRLHDSETGQASFIHRITGYGYDTIVAASRHGDALLRSP